MLDGRHGRRRRFAGLLALVVDRRKDRIGLHLLFRKVLLIHRELVEQLRHYVVGVPLAAPDMEQDFRETHAERIVQKLRGEVDSLLELRSGELLRDGAPGYLRLRGTDLADDQRVSVQLLVERQELDDAARGRGLGRILSGEAERVLGGMA